ncbi:DUF5696 domain-containing protein [Fictibacillus barbaricus]|uniref:Uncharacterized protein n=1 Tax=Fictibacillus barbaricus TaxID=182136 RepID=A0ABU1U1B4_9BACL|nr:DUF5696 domain-containing protein [Fictibacillus barbaricus]MDR7073227.1 hypothetical protein [Fictibacillus barbaricus]
MFKKLFIILAVLLLPITALAAQNDKKTADKPPVRTEKSQNEMKYTTSQFTKPETGGLTPGQTPKQETSFEGFEKAAENENLVLYVNKESLAIKIQDKKTKYVWNSGLDHPEKYRLNQTWEQMAQSALTVEYTDRRGKLRTESITSNKTRPQVRTTAKGFTAKVDFNQAKIEFQMNVELDQDSLVVSIPYNKVDDGRRTKLISLKVYPFLGAVNEDDINGYMFIPDGSGALIRYNKSGKTADAPFTGAIYGDDEAFKKTEERDEKVSPVEPIKMPVFGAVHGVKQNAFLTVVEEGYSYSNITAYPAGVSTDFNWISSQFHYRHEYYQPTSKNMQGINVYQKNANPFNIKLRYMFLRQNDADYVGMARAYQDYLVKTDQLKKQKDKTGVRLELLGGEVKEGLLWDSVLPMTPITSIPKMTDELKKNGVNNLFVVYKGWSKGGLTGTLPARFPFEKKLGSKGDVQDTITKLKKDNIPMYFHTDYTKAFEGASGFSGSKDVAKKASSETISNTENENKVFYLSPQKTLDAAKNDVADYKDYGISNLAVDTSGYTLFSDFSDKKSSQRNSTIETYEKVFQNFNKRLGNVALYEPNTYLWNTADRYLDIPMYSSNYVYETDTVPFMQIVLKGYMPYYAPFSNFYSDPKDQVLRMIEYGAYPSFLLTKEPSHLLMKTPSKDVYTSEFSIWKDDIAEQYKKVKKSLGTVEGETIESRSVPKTGVVEVTYSNGTKIIVNYTDSAYQSNGAEVAAKDFEVIERGN